MSTDERLDRIEAALKQAQMAIAQLRFDQDATERRSLYKSERIVEFERRIDWLSDRVHAIEDLFEPGNAIALLDAAVMALAVDVELLKQAREASDGK